MSDNFEHFDNILTLTHTQRQLHPHRACMGCPQVEALMWDAPCSIHTHFTFSLSLLPCYPDIEYLISMSCEKLEIPVLQQEITYKFTNVGYSTFFEGTRPRRSSHGMPPVQSTLNLPSACHCCRVIQILNI